MLKKFSPFLFVFILILTVIFIVPSKALASSSGLVIDEFKIAGDGGSYDEYITLANYGTETIDLKNYSLKKKTKSGSKYNLYTFAELSLEPNKKVILANSKYLGEKDLVYTNSIAADNTIILYDPSGKTIDLVGYGEVPEFETAPLPNPEVNEVYSRTGGVDTDNNLSDFSLVRPASLVDINADKVLITEVLPNPEDGQEWFELYNPTNRDISLFGLKICDGAGRTHCYSFKEGYTLTPYQYKTYDQSETKITLNNDGDWLELTSDNEIVISSTGDNYGDSDSGNSYALFGSQWMWTKTPTKAAENTFTDIIEVEPVKAVKVSVKKASAKSTKSVTDTQASEEKPDESNLSTKEAEVKGDSVANLDSAKNNKISQKAVGYGVIGLAIAILLGYTLWENKERISDFIKRIGRRNG